MSHDLVINRRLMAPRAALYRCWTEAELLKRWFAPLPYTTPFAELDVRAGGSQRIVMRGPDGKDIPTAGVYLDVVPGERLVMTDAFTSAWVPSQKAFIVIATSFADESDGTRYIARVSHWSEDDRLLHEQMGFHIGWNQGTDQLERLAASL